LENVLSDNKKLNQSIVLESNRLAFPNINIKYFQHLFDLKASQHIDKIPASKDIYKTILKFINDDIVELNYLNGFKKYFIMLYRELVDALDEEELLFVRGLIACQNLAKAQSALAKLLSFTHRYESEINIEEILKQDKSIESLDFLPTIVKFFILLNSTHPFIPNRIKELQKWTESIEYKNLLNGIYLFLEHNYSYYSNYLNYPTYPNYPAYQNYPNYSNYSSYTNYQYYPSYPNYPSYQAYPIYPNYQSPQNQLSSPNYSQDIKN
jgi:flagellar biosynthesis/type III secretory pathway chaperone